MDKSSAKTNQSLTKKTTSNLSLVDTQGIFYLLLLGLLISSLMFFYEKCQDVINTLRSEEGKQRLPQSYNPTLKSWM